MHGARVIQIEGNLRMVGNSPTSRLSLPLKNWPPAMDAVRNAIEADL